MYVKTETAPSMLGEPHSDLAMKGAVAFLTKVKARETKV
jgi:hypothetical protein